MYDLQNASPTTPLPPPDPPRRRRVLLWVIGGLGILVLLQLLVLGALLAIPGLYPAPVR